MKALIIYDGVASALKTIKSLRGDTFGTEIKVHWKINIWPVRLLRIGSVADEALKDAVDANLIVLAG